MNAIPDGPTSSERILDFMRIIGNMGNNLNIVSSKQAGSSLGHFRSTLDICVKLIDIGYLIHLIESTTADGIVKFRDIDILASLDGDVTFIDVTQGKTKGLVMQNGFAVQPRGSYQSKYLVLEGKTTVEHESLVLTSETNFDCSNFSILCPEIESRVFEDEFEFIDSSMDNLSGLTRETYNRIVSLYGDALTEEGNLPCVSNPPRLASFGSDNLLKVPGALAKNNMESAELFTEFMSTLITAQTTSTLAHPSENGNLR